MNELQHPTRVRVIKDFSHEWVRVRAGDVGYVVRISPLGTVEAEFHRRYLDTAVLMLLPEEYESLPEPQEGIAVQLHDPEWRWCSAERLDRAVGRAEFFESLGASEIIVWYDDREDFVRVEFNLEGSHYVVRTYKIHSVEKDGSDWVYSHGFPQEHNLFEFFGRGKHREWVAHPEPVQS
jgi:hypothetical protein